MAASNTGILTYNSAAFTARLWYYSPIAVIPVINESTGVYYAFLARPLPWADENNIPLPEQSQKYMKDVFKNAFAAKKIGTNDISPVIQRSDWQTGIYDYYDDAVDMFETDINGNTIKNFFVKNRYDQVFKCLWNNNRATSTVEPYFEPGTFNSTGIFQGADSYKWKYIYTITSGQKIKFMDAEWMPVPITDHSPDPASAAAGLGNIEVINVVNGGNGYNTLVSPINVIITGDGTGASANAVVSGGVITDIIVSNPGTNYTYANVSITSATGNGSTVIAPVSPISGHGADPMAEFGVAHTMLAMTFNKDETGLIPTDIDFRQIGIIVDPHARFGTGEGTANGTIYKLTTDFVVSVGFGAYTPDETVFQSPDSTLASSTFRATVLSFDAANNTLKTINTQGTPLNNTLMTGQTSGTSRVMLQKQDPDFVKGSGYMIYLENRKSIQRNPDGSEQFKLVIGP